MAAEVVALCIDRSHTTTSQDHADAVDFDEFASLQSIDCAVNVKRNSRAVGLHQAEHVFLHRKPGIDLADREDGTVGVAGVA